MLRINAGIGVAGGLDYNGAHGCHTLLTSKQWRMICLAIGAAVLSPPCVGTDTPYTVPLPRNIETAAAALLFPLDELRALMSSLRMA